jgi:hypothetical protein
LQVRVHDSDHLSGGELEPSRDGSLMPEVPGQRDGLEPGILLMNRCNLTEGLVGRAIVYEDDFPAKIQTSEYLLKARLEVRKDGSFIEAGNDDAEVWLLRIFHETRVRTGKTRYETAFRLIGLIYLPGLGNHNQQILTGTMVKCTSNEALRPQAWCCDATHISTPGLA